MLWTWRHSAGKLAVRPFAEVRPAKERRPIISGFICYGEFSCIRGWGTSVCGSHRALPGGKKLSAMEDATLEGVRQQAHRAGLTGTAPVKP